VLYKDVLFEDMLI